jgi:hypothetical protein
MLSRHLLPPLRPKRRWHPFWTTRLTVHAARYCSLSLLHLLNYKVVRCKECGYSFQSLGDDEQIGQASSCTVSTQIEHLHK